MDARIIIDLGDIPKKQLLECRNDIQQMFEEFTEKHPDIIIPSDAVRIEGNLLGIKFSRGLFG